MNTTIKKSLQNSFSYQEYRNLIAKLANDGATTGEIQTETNIGFTKLNDARMHRLDKTIQINEEVQKVLENTTKSYIWLVIAESWCGDAAQILPIINKMAQITSKIELRIVLRDQNDDLMLHFLTNGTKSIPKLLLLDAKTNEVLNNFGPRPIGAKEVIENYKNKHGIVDETAKIELQKWYLTDKGISTQKEILALM